MTHDEASQLVAMLAAAYPSTKATRATFQLYERKLMALDAEAGLAAVDSVMTTCKFFPSLAELMDAARGPTGVALEEWGEVCRAIQRLGHYQPAPPFPDHVTRRCVESMGWRYLCKSPNDMSDRARFCDLYESLRDRQRAHGTLEASKGATVHQLHKGPA